MSGPIPQMPGSNVVPMQQPGQALMAQPQPAPMPPPTLHDAVFRRLMDESQVRVEALAPDEALIDRRSGPKDPPWGHRRLRTVSDLTQQYPDKKDVITTATEDTSADYTLERTERFSDEGFLARDSAGTLDPTMKQLWVTDCYFHVDFDGDGYAELRKITVIGGTPSTVGSILENVEIDSNPMATLTPVPIQHKLIGQSMADKVSDLQDIKTALTRNLLDNLYLQNGTELAITGEWDIDALLNRRPANIIRGKPGATIAPLPTTPMTDSILAGINYVDTVRETRTGVRRFQAGPGGDVLSSALETTLGGLDKVESSSQERIEEIARIFAETGFKQLFRLIHEMVCKHQKEPRQVKLGGAWAEMDPTDWETRKHLTVSVGLGTGDKKMKLQFLGAIAAKQELIIQTGGVHNPIAGPQEYYNTLAEMVTAAGFTSPDPFFKNPGDNPAALNQPPAPNPELLKIQADTQNTQAKLQAEQQKTIATLQAKQGETEAQIASAERLKVAELQSAERQGQLTAAVQRELGYAKIAVDNKAIDMEVQLKQRQHETDTAFKAHGAKLEEREADREDRVADVQNAKAQHDAEHDTASLTQAGDQFQAQHAQKNTEMERAAKTSDRDFNAKNPNYKAPSPEITAAPPKPRKMVKIGLTHDAGGMVAAAKRHFDDGTSEDIPIERTGGAA